MEGRAHSAAKRGYDKGFLSTSHVASGLVKHGVNLVAVLHLQLIWGLLTTKPAAIKKECNGIHVHRLAVAIGVHQLLQLGGPLDTEEHLIAILSYKRVSEK
jgi:hypothetical protein